MKKTTSPYIENLSWTAKPDIFKKAKDLRKSMTQAETILWRHLRNGKLNGLKFRRQHPIFIFIADFYCHQKKLIIELDGEIHNDPEQKEHDLNRSADLEEKGFIILRFRNEEVISDLEKVLERIIRQCGKEETTSMQ
jgi:very-short-patch-repair endonuclease